MIGQRQADKAQELWKTADKTCGCCSLLCKTDFNILDRSSRCWHSHYWHDCKLAELAVRQLVLVSTESGLNVLL